MIIKQRILQLRKMMYTHHISTYIINGADPHLSEYVPTRWATRFYFSGFSGSAGTLVITTDKAVLFTDSRYFLQADQELEGSSIELIKEGLPSSPSLSQWIIAHTPASGTVAIQGETISATQAFDLKAQLESASIHLHTSYDLIDPIWSNRPPLADAPAYLLDPAITGASTAQKLAQVRDAIRSHGATLYIVGGLDEIAWLYNIRGNDIAYNPVITAFSIIQDQKATLYIASHKITPELASTLEREHVSLANYEDFYDDLALLPHSTIVLDSSKINQKAVDQLSISHTLLSINSIINQLKCCKNPTEIAGIKRAMIKDGVALTQFMITLEELLPTGQLSEIWVSETLRKCRSQQQDFVEESFNTIAGYKEHGAIVHYSAIRESNLTLEADGLLLFDSGAQYLHGTTDITRTYSLGNPTKEQKEDYTSVLKGHIAIAQALFPQGTRGAQLDILARRDLWRRGKNYLHGTGHGVGFFLNVHEGPQSIRLNENPTTLELGMLTSNEPGVYIAGQYGIRLENLVLVTKAFESEFGKFYQFETLTLFPFDTSLIDTNALSSDEIKWLNQYHQRVYLTLLPHLTQKQAAWLYTHTQPI